MSARWNHVPSSSSIDRSISSSAGVVPRSAATSPSVRPTRSRLRVEGDVADEVRWPGPCPRRESRRRRPGRDEQLLARRRARPRAASLSAAVVHRQDVPPAGDGQEHDAALGHRPGDVDRPGLHLRPHPAPLAHARSTASITWSVASGVGGACGTAATASWRSPNRRRQLGQQLDAADGQPGVVELVDDLQHPARARPSTALSASSSACSANRHGTGRMSSSTST